MGFRWNSICLNPVFYSRQDGTKVFKNFPPHSYGNENPALEIQFICTFTVKLAIFIMYLLSD